MYLNHKKTIKRIIDEYVNMKDQKPGSFPDSLKYANARPIYEKLESFDKNTFGPVHYHFYQSL